MQKHAEKHIFTTFDSFSVFGLIAGVIVLIGSIISTAMIDQKQYLARVRSEQLAVQIIVGGYRGLEDQAISMGAGGRSPANAELDISPEGRIGMDPWGTPYYYKLSEESDSKKKVTVLSAGPNRRRESIEALAGDDLAATIER